MHRTILFLIFALCGIHSAYGQVYTVRPVGDFLSDYKGKYRIILATIEQSELPLPQRLALYEEEMTKLKTQFKTERKAEYESKSTTLSKGHSCTSGSSGGVKNCGWKCVDAPTAHLYTKADWIRVDGTNKGTKVSEDGSSACLKMTVAGEGRNHGTLHAIFKYRPESILSLIDSETRELFNQVILP